MTIKKTTTTTFIGGLVIGFISGSLAGALIFAILISNIIIQ